jgi:hypothetical protein
MGFLTEPALSEVEGFGMTTVRTLSIFCALRRKVEAITPGDFLKLLRSRS